MPVLDGDFEAFVTNLGKYNEGMLIGEWVKLPTTEEEMQKVFERIGIGKQDEFGQPYEEWFITDYECPIYGVQKMLGEYESLDKLNYLAALIDELSLSDQEKLVAVMEAGCDEVSDKMCIRDRCHTLAGHRELCRHSRRRTQTPCASGRSEEGQSACRCV